jgi:4-carboxymuconolactone decarboxylase
LKDYFDNMDLIESNLKYFMEQHESIYSAYEEYGRLIHEEGGPLDEKTRWLIKIALSTESQYEYALRTHILKGIKSGCTLQEIKHAILLVAPTAGFPKTMSGLLVFRQLLEESNIEKSLVKEEQKL